LAADTLKSQDLIDLMIANDSQLDRVLITIEYTDLSVSPPPTAKMLVPLPDGRIAPVAGNNRIEFDYNCTYDASIDPSTLPNPNVLFNFAVRHAEEIRAGIVSTQPDAMTAEQSEWLRLLVEKKISPSRKKKPTGEARASEQETVTELIAIYGLDIVVIHDPESEKQPTRKFSSVSGRATMMISRLTDGPNSPLEWINDSRQLSQPLDAYQELALWRLFTLGVGFGPRIKTIENLETNGNLTTVDATLRIWPGRETAARLQIDSDRIVRKAVINAGVTRIHVETAGVKQLSPSCRVAASGSFRREYKGSPTHTAPEFRLKLKNLEFNLDSGRFAEIADLSAPDGERVSDVTPRDYSSRMLNLDAR
jgi:hypothetical protein